MGHYVKYNIPNWLKENEKFFLPPVCNKMMHGDGQLKVFYVGGPNVRKDFHLEEGEELFFMRTGDMNLILQEGGKFKDVIIKEGEVFLLPGKIPHSPQRIANTTGLVIERERMKTETDGLRYFVEGTTEILYEKWFYCEDLGTQLGPLIKGYFASEAHQTGKPTPGSISTNPPWTPDSKRVLEEPFLLNVWLNKHRNEISQEGTIRLFDTSYQTDISMLGEAFKADVNRYQSETFLWQIEGESEMLVDGEVIKMKAEDTILVKAGKPFCFKGKEGCVAMEVVMEFANKERGYKHNK